MRSAPHIACFAALGLALLGLVHAHAQEPTPAEADREAWQVAPAERAAAPDVFLLPDASGKLRQVLGFRYEDFLRAWNNRPDSSAGPPRFSIAAIEVAGTAGDSQARLQIDVRIASHVDGWVDVPLELRELVVERVDLGEKTPGECLVYDAARGGHVAWLEGKAGQERTIHLVGSTKIAATAGKSVLEIAAPQALQSQLTLSVPDVDLAIETSPGMELKTTVADQQTDISVRGNARPLRVQWQRRDDAAESPAITLEANGEIAVRVERGRALYTGRLRINSFGNPLEVIRVRLPQGAMLTKWQAPAELQAELSEASHEENGIVEIRPHHPANHPWTLELSAEQSWEASAGASVSEIGGFEVLGAVRQSGRLTLEVDDQLQAYFDLSENLEQALLEQTDDQAAPRAALAAFEYATFPWTLSVHTQPEQRRVTIEPRYRLHFAGEEARLEMEFDYQFSGARTFAVRVDLRGWQLGDAPVESGGAVEASRVVETEEGLVLPLVNPDAPRTRIALAVRKPLELGTHSFALPEALGGFILPGRLEIEADPSLEVTVDASRLEGLGAVAATGQETAPDENRQAFRTFLARPTLAATIARRPRQVAVQSTTNVNVGAAVLGVRQQFDYLVKHQPLAEVRLDLPASLPEKRALKVIVDGKEVSTTTALAEGEADESPARQLVVSLPQGVQGLFHVEVAYEVPYAGAAPGSSTSVAVPLVSPVDSLVGNHVMIEAEQPRRVALGQTADAAAWILQPVEASPAMAVNVWRMQSAAPESVLPLVVHTDSLEDLQNAILERAWMQSWVAGASQQDRAVFRFRTPHAKVHLELPDAVAALPLEVLLDGEPVEFDPPTEGRISLVLSHVSPTVRHVVEVRYQYPANLLSGTTLQVAMPKLVCRPMSAPVYWQLVLPRGWQVAQAPAGMTSESWLGWKAYRWGRQPTRSQSDLEQWTGATSAPPPPLTASQYLYSAFEVPPGVEVVVTRQIWLVLATTLVAFGVGMLCVNTTIVRKFAFWLAAALALLALVFVYPELTLLVGQAILWGGVMTLAVLVLRRAFLDQPRPQMAIGPASSLIGTTSATESWVQQQHGDLDGDDGATVARRLEGSQS